MKAIEYVTVPQQIVSLAAMMNSANGGCSCNRGYGGFVTLSVWLYEMTLKEK